MFNKIFTPFEDNKDMVSEKKRIHPLSWLPIICLIASSLYLFSWKENPAFLEFIAKKHATTFQQDVNQHLFHIEMDSVSKHPWYKPLKRFGAKKIYGLDLVGVRQDSTLADTVTIWFTKWNLQPAMKGFSIVDKEKNTEFFFKLNLGQLAIQNKKTGKYTFLDRLTPGDDLIVPLYFTGTTIEDINGAFYRRLVIWDLHIKEDVPLLTWKPIS